MTRQRVTQAKRALNRLVRTVDAAVGTLSMAGGTLLNLDTNPVPAEWDHVSKVDPEGEKQLPIAFPLYLAHTSAVSVGGSQGVTAANTEETMALVEATGVPVVHEPSGAAHVTGTTRASADVIAIPEVLNGEMEALIGTLGQGLDHVRETLTPELVERRIGVSLDPDGRLGKRLGNFAAGYLMREAVFEAYIIMNPDSAAAREAGVTEADLLSTQRARERALAAEHHLESEILYLEYSGTFGGEEALAMLEALDGALSSARLWYGGGLDSGAKSEAVRAAGADTVVVGDVLHEIAGVEASLLDRARTAFGDTPEHSRLTDWVTDAVDVGETSAARYLSTVPAVSDAERHARRYLAAGVEFALVVETVADRFADPDGDRIAATLAESSLLAETWLAGQLDTEAGSELVRRLAGTLLGERFGVDVPGGFAARHIGSAPGQ